jgi:putative FmdB family regulatory protein
VPLYEYECAACRKRFELRQKVTDEAVSVCPSCGGSVRRLIHPVGIIFKGSGFYVTDNRKSDTPSSTTGPAEAPAAKSGDGAKTEGAPKSDSPTKSDAAPATTTTKSTESTSKPATSASSTSS